MRATVRCPGTCGELVQGTQAERHFLITCPVNLYAEATVELVPADREISGLRAHPKTEQAVRRTLDRLGLGDCGARVTVGSTLPQGKGMASSTADIAAAAKAAALAAGRELSADQIADLALSIEPSDGVMYAGIWMFDHVAGTLRQKLGNAVPLTIIALDPGGRVDTVVFNARADLPAKNKAKEKQIQEAADLVKQGIARGDPYQVGQGATLSARANQDILYKPELEEVLAFAARLGAVGVNVAHSGTLIGALFPREANCQGLVARFARRFPRAERVFALDLIDGGLQVVRQDERLGGGRRACQ